MIQLFLCFSSNALLLVLAQHNLSWNKKKKNLVLINSSGFNSHLVGVM